jgi:hypothetical protein
MERRGRMILLSGEGTGVGGKEVSSSVLAESGGISPENTRKHVIKATFCHRQTHLQ